MDKKILYVSDLDGTLLRSDQTTSPYTIDVINKLTDKGIIFSYATARSVYSSSVVTKGLDARIPIIVYNGAFILDNSSRGILDSNYLGEGAGDLLKDLFANGIYPTVYSMIDGRERFSNWREMSSPGTIEFIDSRNDERKRIVHSEEELLAGDIFYITCIEDADKILPFYDKYKDIYHCVYQKDIYSDNQWLEIMPTGATKASAIRRLKEMTGCNYVVAFGDAVNDLEMFQIADESYAMANAEPELKAIATAVIDSNDNDGVAHWLEDNLS